jgi:hypothetical protein
MTTDAAAAAGEIHKRIRSSFRATACTRGPSRNRHDHRRNSAQTNARIAVDLAHVDLDDLSRRCGILVARDAMAARLRAGRPPKGQRHAVSRP